MTPPEWTACLDALARAEALEAHHAERARRDPQGLALARATVKALRSTVAVAAPTTAALTPPEPSEWASIPQAARILQISKDACRMRARRGVANGMGRKVGGRWLLRLPSPA